MECRFEGLRHRLEDLQLHLSTTSHQEFDSKNEHKLKTKPSSRPLKPSKLRDSENSPPPTKQQPRFQTAINPSKGALNGGAAAKGDAATVSGLLTRLKEGERQRTSERASLQLQIQKERQRAQNAEAASRRAADQRDFRLGEVRHLKAALQRRDDMITDLQDNVRDLEVGVSCAEAVQAAEGKGSLFFFIFHRPSLQNIYDGIQVYLICNAAERDEIKDAYNDAQSQLERLSAQLDAANCRAADGEERLKKKERNEVRIERQILEAQEDAVRFSEELQEEREARVVLEHAMKEMAKQTAARQARLRHLLALGEVLMGNDCGELLMSEESSDIF